MDAGIVDGEVEGGAAGGGAGLDLETIFFF